MDGHHFVEFVGVLRVSHRSHGQEALAPVAPDLFVRFI